MKSGDSRIRLIEFEYHRPGKGTQIYRQFLVEDRPDLKVLLQPAYPGRDIYLPGRFAQERGAPILWFHIAGMWCDIGRLYMKDPRTFTGWYTNLCTPIEFEGGRARSTDLFLDFWQPVEGNAVWVDEDEFAEAFSSGALTRDLYDRAIESRAEIQRLYEAGDWPPAPVTGAPFETYLARLTER